jgi:dihydrofolate reductase
MRSLTVTMNVSLDGVVQGVGRPDEDTRGDFTHGGWGTWHQDDVLAREMGKGMSRPGDMLFGRRTWQDLNAVRKYVVSTTLEDADAWPNSVLLRGDATRSVAELKAQDGDDLGIVGSASLVRSLHAAGLIDHYTLVIHPLTLGSGARLFEGTAPLTHFALVRSVATPTGVIVAYYDRR